MLTLLPFSAVGPRGVFRLNVTRKLEATQSLVRCIVVAPWKGSGSGEILQNNSQFYLYFILQQGNLPHKAVCACCYWASANWLTTRNGTLIGCFGSQAMDLKKNTPAVWVCVPGRCKCPGQIGGIPVQSYVFTELKKRFQVDRWCCASTTQCQCLTTWQWYSTASTFNAIQNCA